MVTRPQSSIVMGKLPQVKAEKFRTHDPLKTMSAFDTQPWHHGQPEPWVMGGALRPGRQGH